MPASLFYVEAHNYQGLQVEEADLIDQWGPYATYPLALVAGRAIRGELAEFGEFVAPAPSIDQPPWDSADAPLWEDGDSVLLSIRRDDVASLVGKRVRIHSLQNNANFNGAEGRCIRVTRDEQRIVVKLCQQMEVRRGTKTRFGLRIENLQILGSIDFGSCSKSGDGADYPGSGDDCDDHGLGGEDAEDAADQPRETLKVLFASLLPQCVSPSGAVDEVKLRKLMESAVQSSLPQPSASPVGVGAFRRLKQAEAAMITRLLKREAGTSAIGGIGIDIGTGVHGFGLMAWASEWNQALKWYPTDCTQLLDDNTTGHAERTLTAFAAQCERAAHDLLLEGQEERAAAVADLPSRWLRLDVLEDPTAWRTGGGGRDAPLGRLRGRAAVVTCVDLLSVFKAGDVKAGHIRRPRVVLDVLRCFATFLACPQGRAGGIGIWLDRGLGDERHFGGGGGMLRRMLPRLAEGFGLVATETAPEVLLHRSERDACAGDATGIESDPCFTIRWNESTDWKVHPYAHLDTPSSSVSLEEAEAWRFCHAPQSPEGGSSSTIDDKLEAALKYAREAASPPTERKYSTAPPPLRCRDAWSAVDACLRRVSTNEFLAPIPMPVQQQQQQQQQRPCAAP